MAARARLSLAAGLLLAVVATADTAWAHGGPEKVVDDRFVVSLSVAPADDVTQLRFFLRDFRTGRDPADPISFRVRILAEGAPTVVYQSPPLAMASRGADVLHRFPREGFYEIFVEFWLDREPGQIFRPEDWRIWIGGRRSAGDWLPIAVVGALTLAIAAITVTMRHARAET